MAASDRLAEAARAAWLYYVAGNTQDQIALKLGVSRQAAQRLVSLAVTENLVRIRIDHPIAACLELGRALTERFGLRHCEVVPTDPARPDALFGLARAVAVEMERHLSRPEPLVMAIGTGRSLQAAIEQLLHVDCPQHRVVSLTGTISPDGSTVHYNVIYSMADRITGKTYPLPFPVLASSADERRTLQAQLMIKPTIEMATHADVAFVGVGDLGADAPLLSDGFITARERELLEASGAAGEIVGWVFDADGRLIEGLNDRVVSAAIPDRERSLVVAVANGRRKYAALRAALRGGLVNGLVTDEAMAGLLLDG